MTATATDLSTLPHLEFTDEPLTRAAVILRDTSRHPHERARAAVDLLAAVALTPRPPDAPYLDLIGAWQRYQAALVWHRDCPPHAG